MTEISNIVKIDVLLSNGTFLLSESEQFSFPFLTPQNKKVENMLMIKGELLPELRMNTLVDIIINDRNGDRYRYSGRITMSSRFQMNIQFKPFSKQLVQERRRYYKIKTSQPCTISFITRNGKVIRFDNPIKANITDFNIGGVFLESVEEPMEQNDVAMLLIELLNTSLELPTLVLRVTDLPDGTKGYGCRFLNVTRQHEETLGRFVNHIQRELIHKERRMEYLELED